jgi:hypothetical protein
MRVIFLICFLVGAALGFAYPWMAINLSGHGLGTWRVYDPGIGYRPADIRLNPADEPVRIFVDMRVVGEKIVPDGQSLLTVAAATAGRTVLTSRLTFSDATLKNRSGYTNELVYQEDAGLIRNINVGTYTFAVAPGDEKGIDIQSVDIVLRSHVLGVNELVRAFGFLLMAAGVVGLIFAIRRQRRIQWQGRPPMPSRGQDYES